MGNVFIKKEKPAVALKQIHYGDEGLCYLCKKISTGFYIYNVELKKTVFICNRCYIIGG